MDMITNVQECRNMQNVPLDKENSTGEQNNNHHPIFIVQAQMRLQMSNLKAKMILESGRRRLI